MERICNLLKPALVTVLVMWPDLVQVPPGSKGFNNNYMFFNDYTGLQKKTFFFFFAKHEEFTIKKHNSDEKKVNILLQLTMHNLSYN